MALITPDCCGLTHLVEHAPRRAEPVDVPASLRPALKALSADPFLFISCFLIRRSKSRRFSLSITGGARGLANCAGAFGAFAWLQWAVLI